MARAGAGVLVAVFVISTSLTPAAAMPLPGMGGRSAGAEMRLPASGAIGATGAALSRRGPAIGSVGPTRLGT